MTLSTRYRSTQIGHSVKWLVLSGLIAIASTEAQAQATVRLAGNEADDVVRLRQALAKSTQLVVDTTVKGMRDHVESVANSASRAANNAGTYIAGLTDSLILSAHDSLDVQRRDSLHALGESLRLQLVGHELSTRQALDLNLACIHDELLKARGAYSLCTNCESRSEFDEKLADFRDLADSVVSGFHDSTSAIAEVRADLFADALETAIDSLHDSRDRLIDNRLNDIEVWRYSVSRVVLSSSYGSHTSYRGRDNGLLQQSVAPSVTYRHSSGLSLQTAASWLHSTENRWDNVQVSGGYDFRLGGIVGGSLSYTHFWFNDSSKSELSVFTDNAQAGISFDWSAVSIAVLGSLNFGKASEFTLASSISHDFEIPLSLYNKVTISPAVTWTVGQQNSDLTTLLTTKAKGKKAVVTTSTQTKSTTTFSLLDYEFSLPAMIELGPVTLVPSATYIVPFNVVDASSKTSFWVLEFSVVLTIR